MDGEYMKILVVGLGVIGTGYGWAFTDAQYDVTHLVRPGRAKEAALRSYLDILDLRPERARTRKAIYRPSVTESVSPADGYDLVIVPVKHYQLAGTLRELKESLPDGRFLLLSANWAGLDEIDAVLPRSQYLWAYPASTGGHDEDLLVFNLSPKYRTGPIDGERPSWARRVEDLFGGTGMTPDRKPDMREWLWLHFAQAAGTIGSVLYAGGLAEFYEDEAGLRDRMVPAVRECFAVLAARGVDAAAWPEAAPYLTLPTEQIAATTKRTATTPWVQRTLRTGHFTENAEEMRRFYLEVLGTGEALGVPMPVMQSFRERVLAGA
jgi:2-dehydropantoate 2-reductase